MYRIIDLSTCGKQEHVPHVGTYENGTKHLLSPMLPLSRCFHIFIAPHCLVFHLVRNVQAEIAPKDRFSFVLKYYVLWPHQLYYLLRPPNFDPIHTALRQGAKLLMVFPRR